MMDAGPPRATPTTSTTGSVANLFSTIAGEISADTVNSVISDLNLFRSGSGSLPQWDSPQTTPTTAHGSPLRMESGDTPTTSSSVTDRSLHSEPGTSSDAFSAEHARQSSCKAAMYLEDAVFLPLTPPTSDPGPSGSLSSDLNNLTPTTNSHSDSDQEMPARKKRAPVPSEKKDERYWERRKKNNIAAKRSRELRRKKIDEELKQAQDAIQENQKLKQEIEVLKAEINSLRRLLKDANMTLSLWIRAKQTAEPNAQLPPMLRGPNVPFVNFPVSSTV